MGSSIIENADNLTVTPWDDLIVCEDTDEMQEAAADFRLSIIMALILLYIW